jgi:two-component system phosphate regulon sensor histidine kinase PhoR
MKVVHIKIVTVVGLIAILLLQLVWLNNTYSILKKNIVDEGNRLFEEAVYNAASLNFGNLPKGTKVFGAPVNNDSRSLPECTYMIESFLEYNLETKISQIDSIFKVLLNQKNIDANLYINRILTKDNSIVETTRTSSTTVLGVIKTQTIPFRLDESQSVQAIIINPYWTIFKRMGLLMIATAIMMIMVITCIIYQIKIIIRQDKIAKIREDFSYAMIHDMKTPLSSILACTSLLHSGKMDNLPELKEKYFCIVEDEGGHLLNLANKVLTLSKLENHKLEMSRTVFPLEPMVADLIEKFTAKTAKPVHFTTHLQAKEVCADEEYLKEAISNLIDNAIKYSEELVEIDISSLSNATHTLIKVHDNGIGISEKDRKHIFEKFERASAFKRSRLGKVAGFGLGLNYVYQVMDAHEGSVTVNSVEKEFSEFILYIPIKTENYD